MGRVPLSDLEDDAARFLREAVITRDGKPAGVLIGFGSEDDWLDYRLESDPLFFAPHRPGTDSLRAGRGVGIEDVE